MLTALLSILSLAFELGKTTAPDMPAGLWQNKEEGLVVRITPCGAGFCGAAAGIPDDSTQKKSREACGAQVMKEFVWNAAARRWQGHMQPPDLNRVLDATIVSDGKSYLTLHAHMLIMSKTMQFVAFRGTVTIDCRISQ